MNPFILAITILVLLYCLGVFLYLNYLKFKREKREKDRYMRRHRQTLVSEDVGTEEQSFLTGSRNGHRPVTYDDNAEQTLRAIEKAAMLLGTTNKSKLYMLEKRLCFLSHVW